MNWCSRGTIHASGCHALCSGQRCAELPQPPLSPLRIFAANPEQVLPELTSAAPLLVRFQMPPESFTRRSSMASGGGDLLS